MPDRLRARAVLTALLIAITIVGIQASGPAVGWDPAALRTTIIVGILLEAVLAGLFVTLLRSSRHGAPRQAGGPQAFGPRDQDADLAARLRRILSPVVTGLLIVIPVLIFLVFLAGIGRVWPHRGRLNPARLLPPGSHHLKPSQVGKATQVTIDLAFVKYVLIAVLIAAIVAAVILAWRRGPLRVESPVLADDALDTPADLARAVESGRLALRDVDDARAAIIGCYLAMERTLAHAGAERGMAETPDELLARAVASDLVRVAPAGGLTALFYEARFSSHPMPVAKRDQAEQALAELAATLPSGQAAAGNAQAPGAPR